MLTNIYKGQTTGWYEFDKIIYGNAKNDLDPDDEVMLGRYVLLCYCETAFSKEKKSFIENSEGKNLSSKEETNYWDNYYADSEISKDRMIYKKVYKNKKIQYIEIGRISEIKDNSLNFPGEKTPEGGEIFNDYENNQARTPMSSARGEGTIAGGRGFEIIGFVEELINYFEPYLGSKTEDGYGWKFDVVLPPGTYTITEHTGGSAYSGSIINKATGNDLYSWNFDYIEGDIWDLVVTAGNNPFELTTETTISVDYFNPDASICCKCFNNDKRVKGYKLKDSTDNIVEGDTYSVCIGNNYDNQGIIESVDKDNNTVTVTNSTKGTTTTLTNAYLWLPVMPEDWSTYDDPDTKTSLKATRKINAGTTYMDKAQYAEGSETYAINYAAHAEGNRTVAAGRWSHAEGNGTYAAYAAHSEGSKTKAIGQCSHAQGNETEASGYAAHSGGSKTIASGDYSFAHGMQNQASGQYSTAIGYKNEATAESAVAIGYENKTMAKGSVSLGVGNTIDEGSVYSIALGQNLKTQNNSNFTINLGRDNLIGGLEDIGAHYSATIGQGLITKASNQIAVGKYNNPDKITNHDWPVFMVGYGTSDSNRKNVFEVDRNGVATVGADPIDNMDVATKQYVDNSISSLNPTVDLSGYMPLTGGTIINEENPTASIIINPGLLKIDYVLTGFNSFIQMGADKEIGYDEQQFSPKFSGYIELSNEKCNKIPSSTFTITAIGVEGNNTAKASWRQWLGITTEDGSIDLSVLENKITQLENKIKELENASPVLKE